MANLHVTVPQKNGKTILTRLLNAASGEIRQAVSGGGEEAYFDVEIPDNRRDVAVAFAQKHGITIREHGMEIT